MKIGILTFQRADNYGAMLQCYALQEFIRRAGHEVEIIDYRNANLEKDHEVIFRLSEWVTFLIEGHLKTFLTYIPNIKKRKYRRTLFSNFRNKYLALSEAVAGDKISSKYDRIIIGSDQMWTIGCYKQYDPVYWGQFPHDAKCKIFGYAISSKADFMMHLSVNQVRQIVSTFSGLSFREQKIAEIFECLTGNEFPVTVDPTLLWGEELWTPLLDKKWSNRRFVAVYYVRGSVKSIMEDAFKFAQEHHCDVINLASKSYSIEDFVSAIKFAQAVFTSSFHATVFSLIFKRPFTSYCLQDGNDDRYACLLKNLGQDAHLVDYGSKYVEPQPVDKEYLDRKLKEYRKDSEIFIDKIIK